MKLNAEQARDMAKTFRCVSVALGEFRFANWDTLTKGQRDILEDREWTLLNYSSDFITQAVGLVLNDVEGSLKNIQDATAKAKEVVEKIKTIKKVIMISGAVIKLAAAIASENPGAVASAAGEIFTAVSAKEV